MMRVAHVEILVEEPSMEAALRLLIPRIAGTLSFGVYPYLCKDDLLKKLPQRLRGYKSWLPEDWRILVLIDRDDDDCRRLKARMEAAAASAGLTTRARAGNSSCSVVNRLAIEELEAWYFGDWEAVLTAYPRVPRTVPNRAAYRDPDDIRGGTWEAFERVLQRAGYFKGGLRKIEAARAIAQHWVPDRNNSTSFRVFRDALREMVAEADT